MAASLEAFKSFKTVGVVVFADSKKDKASLPKGVADVRAKGGNTIPIVFVTTADGEKGIDALPYSDLKADMRKAVRELRKSLEDVDVIGGVDSADEANVSKEEEKEKAPEFKLRSTIGNSLSNMAGNNQWFGVSLDSNAQERILTATTLDHHPLVGNRYWSVTKKKKSLLQIKTNARVRARNLLNLIGSATGGEDDVSVLWEEYLNNNADEVIEEWGG